ncbi:DegT/DnrJ/EryC1/StrS family aminotransferase [Prochlorococcus sp. MIT 1307]|uniref:DegT/DnrJ/EryC1/StrS family aminotransferase n=1 Tax=Prochlorococcus sp. MIT 1307 TaxID=3096219 RepID=UPI002A75F34B|nr:DegT/DnrJ/EryC1/StrS family aminotransferase [Prochlorococcus sp. MIT 1307]
MPGFEVIDNAEAQAASAVFEEGGVLFAHGFDKLRKRFHVREFENDVSEYFSSEYCQAVSSGTSGIKCALKALGVGYKDEVITQAFNFIATVESIIDCGATPIICNVDENLHLDIEDCLSRVTPKTKAILIVHMLGMAGPIGELKQLAKKLSIPIIEDTCEAIGARQGSSFLGTIADVGVFSFDHGKNITCGEGGMILTNQKDISRYVKSYTDHGHAFEPNKSRGEDNALMPGFNYRMTELQGAIGKAQLKKLDHILEKNIERYSALYEQISSCCKVRESLQDSKGSYDALIIRSLDEATKSKIISILKSQEIGTKNIPDAMNWHCSYYWKHALSDHEVNHSKLTYELLNNSVAIPIWLSRSIDEYTKLGHTIKSLFN